MKRRQISISWLYERKVFVKAVLQVIFESECARKRRWRVVNANMV